MDRTRRLINRYKCIAFHRALRGLPEINSIVSVIISVLATRQPPCHNDHILSAAVAVHIVREKCDKVVDKPKRRFNPLMGTF